MNRFEQRTYITSLNLGIGKKQLVVEELHITYPTYQSMCRGCIPSIKTLNKISQYYKTSNMQIVRDIKENVGEDYILGESDND